MANLHLKTYSGFAMLPILLLPLTIAGFYKIYTAFNGDAFSFWSLLWAIILLFLPALWLFAVTSVILESRYLRKRLSAIRQEDLLQIYAAIEAISDQPSTCFRLGRTGLTSQTEGISIPLPSSETLAQWNGQTISLKPDRNGIYVPQLETSTDARFASVHNEKYVFVGVPKKIRKNGKSHNRFQYEYYLEQSPSLTTLVKTAFPKVRPASVLQFLFETYGHNGSFLGFDGCFIGGYPRWIQEPEFPKCPQCKRKMVHLLEIGSNKSAWNNRVGQSYIFSCSKHPSELVTETQWD